MLLKGKWTIERPLGEGGAGVVYRGRGLDGAPVAIKVLRRELAEEPTVRDRFMREAYVANTIGHPGVVRVLDDGVDEDDVPFLVMELLEGENYDQRLTRKGGALPVREVLWVADRTLSVLAAAHAKGIVHRDVKPENLFLTRDRKLKVLDFGIARLAGKAAATTVGTVLGTLAFMPPEQARGDTSEIGVQSDLWSVGATMFTLLTRRLVRDEHENEDVRKLLTEAGRTRVPKLKEVAPDVPKALADLVDYALLLETQVRWPTAQLMRRAIWMVHAELARAAGRTVDEEADEISEPSFRGFSPEEIEPPPMSVALPQPADAIAPPAAAPVPSAAAPSAPPWTRQYRVWVAAGAAVLLAAILLVLLSR